MKHGRTEGFALPQRDLRTAVPVGRHERHSGPRTEVLLASFAGGTRSAGDLRHRLAGTAGGAGSPEGHGDTPTPPHWVVRAWAQLAVLNGWLVVWPRVLIESTPESIKRALMCGRGECRGTTSQR